MPSICLQGNPTGVDPSKPWSMHLYADRGADTAHSNHITGLGVAATADELVVATALTVKTNGDAAVEGSDGENVAGRAL